MHRLLLTCSIIALSGFASLAVESQHDLRVLVGEQKIPPRQTMKAFLDRLAADAFARREARLEALKTPEEIAEYQQSLRRFYIERFGGLPQVPAFNPQKDVVEVGRHELPGYRIEKIIYTSQPGHHVTANVYVPTTGQPPFPAVLVPCGHSANGKAAGSYQLVSALLAVNGIVAMCYDPIGQGERYQLLDDAGRPRFKSTGEHTLLGIGAILLGRSLAQHRIWDGMRGLDYLASRSDVDASKFGCTGNSGGGTLTEYLMAVDPRIQAAAPNGCVTTFQRRFATIGPGDAEQNVFGQVAGGFDHADFTLVRAPRPTLLMCNTRDFVDVQGTWDIFREATRLYTRLRHAECIDLIEDDAGHAYTPRQRACMTRWMRRWLAGDDGPVNEPDLAVLSDEELRCTPQGQVLLAANEVSVVDIQVAEAKRLAGVRKKSPENVSGDRLLAQVRELIGLRSQKLDHSSVQRIATLKCEGYRIEKIVLHPEPELPLPGLLYVPAEPRGQRYLLVHAEGKAAVAVRCAALAQAGHIALAIDVRDSGELGEAGSGKGDTPGFKNIFQAYLLGKTYVAMRAEDILLAAELLAGEPPQQEPPALHLIAIGAAGIPALHAAALEHERFAHVRLERTLRSWEDVVRSPDAPNQLVNVVHNALSVYDLPDLVAVLGDKLEVVEPVDAYGRVIDE